MQHTCKNVTYENKNAVNFSSFMFLAKKYDECKVHLIRFKLSSNTLLEYVLLNNHDAISCPSIFPLSKKPPKNVLTT